MAMLDRRRPGLTPRRLRQCYSIADLQAVAKRRLPGAVFDCLEGGADDEVTIARNRAGYDRYDLLPHVLVDVSHVDLSTTVMGQRIEWPVILSPTGLTRLFHPHGEIGAARAAATAGTIYTLSAASSTSIEDVSRACEGPKWFQIYVWRDRGILKDFIERCRVAGYQALCLTVDAPVFGNRERDLKNGLKLPPELRLQTILDVLLRPGWCYHMLSQRNIELANILSSPSILDRAAYSLAALNEQQFDPTVNWDDVAWMISEWKGPFAIKGILRPDDAALAVSVGASAVIVSNHGGRQLDHAPAAIEVLPEIVDAIDGRADVIIDGGIRRGTDVLKALALGARACMIGRPYVYGIAAGGQAGAERALKLLRDEVERAAKLLGCRSLRDVNCSIVRRRVA